MADLVIYTAVVLDEESREKIKEAFPGKHENYHGEHITLTYGNRSFPDNLGENVSFGLAGVATNEKVEAVAVEGGAVFDGVSNPHITISTAPKAKPKTSQKLLRNNSVVPSAHDMSLTGHVSAYLKLFGFVTEVPETFSIDKVVLPARPQIDTAVALYLLRRYGSEIFTGITEAEIEVLPNIDQEGKSDREFIEEGALLLDVGGGMFDHHKNNSTASELVARFLYVKHNPSIKKMLDFARRDDQEGKGIISDDQLDRAFGLPGLMTALNKSYPDDHTGVMNKVIALLDGHHREEESRAFGMPDEYETKKEAGEVIEQEVEHKRGEVKLVGMKTDNASMAGWLRSSKGPDADVVVLQQSSGHTNVLTAGKYVDLRLVTSLIRQAELKSKGADDFLPHKILMQEGKFDSVPEWYYDLRTNSLLNGGVSPGDVPATNLSFKKIVDRVTAGLEDLRVGDND